MPDVLRAAVLGLALLVVGAAPASAHAALVGSDPADGASMTSAPREVRLDFNEPIGNAVVAVTAPDGQDVAVSDVRSLDRSVEASVAETDQRGTYTLAFRVVSVDGHPVSGTVGFETTTGEAVEQAAPADEPGSFVHRHREHLVWAGIAAVAAVALLVVPLLRRRNA